MNDQFELTAVLNEIENELKECKNLEKLLKKYINGKEVNFEKYYDLNLLNITEFEKKVYKEEEIRAAYLDYSMSVIVSRALPDVRDGLKPVH